MTVRRWISPALIAALLTAVAPATTWAAGADGTKDTAQGSSRLQAAISRAAATAVAKPSLQLRMPARPAAGGVRMQSSGGGHSGMIISLVSTVVGVGATVYMVKQMQKTTKTATAGQ